MVNRELTLSPGYTRLILRVVGGDLTYGSSGCSIPTCECIGTKYRVVSSRQPRIQNAALEEEVGRDYNP